MGIRASLSLVYALVSCIYTWPEGVMGMCTVCVFCFCFFNNPINWAMDERTWCCFVHQAIVVGCFSHIWRFLERDWNVLLIESADLFRLWSKLSAMFWGDVSCSIEDALLLSQFRPAKKHRLISWTAAGCVGWTSLQRSAGSFLEQGKEKCRSCNSTSQTIFFLFIFSYARKW